MRVPGCGLKRGDVCVQVCDCVHACLGKSLVQQPVPARPPDCPPSALPPGRCQLIQGTPALSGGGGYTDYVWVAKDEVGEYIQEPELQELLQKLL